jgi:hypothetical protein
MLHPSGRPALAAGDEVESGPNGKHHGVNPAQMVNNPVLLLGASEANEEQMRLRCGDARDDGGVFFEGKRPEGRAFHIGDLEIGVPLTHSADQCIKNGLVSAVEADRDPGFFGCRQQGCRGIRAADPLRAALSQQAKRPYERHSISENRARFIQLKKESRIVNGFHNHMDIGEKQRAGVPLLSPCKAVMNQLIIAADGDIDPEDRPGGKEILKL